MGLIFSLGGKSALEARPFGSVEPQVLWKSQLDSSRGKKLLARALIGSRTFLSCIPEDSTRTAVEPVWELLSAEDQLGVGAQIA